MKKMKKVNEGQFRFILRSDDGEHIETDIHGDSHDIFEALCFAAENDNGTRLTILLAACEILRNAGERKAENAVFAVVQKETAKMIVN